MTYKNPDEKSFIEVFVGITTVCILTAYFMPLIGIPIPENPAVSVFGNSAVVCFLLSFFLKRKVFALRCGLSYALLGLALLIFA